MDLVEYITNLPHSEQELKINDEWLDKLVPGYKTDYVEKRANIEYEYKTYKLNSKKTDNFQTTYTTGSKAANGRTSTVYFNLFANTRNDLLEAESKLVTVLSKSNLAVEFMDSKGWYYICNLDTISYNKYEDTGGSDGYAESGYFSLLYYDNVRHSKTNYMIRMDDLHKDLVIYNNGNEPTPLDLDVAFKSPTKYFATSVIDNRGSIRYWQLGTDITDNAHYYNDEDFDTPPTLINDSGPQIFSTWVKNAGYTGKYSKYWNWTHEPVVQGNFSLQDFRDTYGNGKWPSTSFTSADLSENAAQVSIRELYDSDPEKYLQYVWSDQYGDEPPRLPLVGGNPNTQFRFYGPTLSKPIPPNWNGKYPVDWELNIRMSFLTNIDIYDQVGSCGMTVTDVNNEMLFSILFEDNTSTNWGTLVTLVTRDGVVDRQWLQGSGILENNIVYIKKTGAKIKVSFSYFGDRGSGTTLEHWAAPHLTYFGEVTMKDYYDVEARGLTWHTYKFGPYSSIWYSYLYNVNMIYDDRSEVEAAKNYIPLNNNDILHLDSGSAVQTINGVENYNNVDIGSSPLILQPGKNTVRVSLPMDAKDPVILLSYRERNK